jgi:hypothetical protein
MTNVPFMATAARSLALRSHTGRKEGKTGRKEFRGREKGGQLLTHLRILAAQSTRRALIMTGHKVRLSGLHA